IDMTKAALSTLGALALALGVSGPAHPQAAYPAKGQSTEQQAKDLNECRSWATMNTGFDPKTPPPQYVPPAEKRGTVAKGVLISGAVGGIAGGDWKGAGIGAAAGGVFGGAKQAKTNNENEAAARASYDQAMAAYNQQRGEHQRAQAACLETRG